MLLWIFFNLATAQASSVGWIAFIAPDFPQTRALFDELKRRTGQDPTFRSHELRFVPVPHTRDRSLLRPPIVAAMAASPRAIVAAADAIAFIAKEESDKIPIIFATGYDPVSTGLVESLAKPGRNLTGFTSYSGIEPKQLELLGELAPTARTIGILDDGTWFGTRLTADHVTAFERTSGMKVKIFTGVTAPDMVRLLKSPEAKPVDAWLVPIHNLTGLARDDIVRTLRDQRKPAIYGRAFFVEHGGLAAYQEVIEPPTAIWHEMLAMVLGGKRAGDIPVRRARAFTMTLNLDEARSQGIELPKHLLLRADKVIGGTSKR